MSFISPNKSVKEITNELSREDEHYFNRFFNTNAEVSQQIYRDTVGLARANALSYVLVFPVITFAFAFADLTNRFDSC